MNIPKALILFVLILLILGTKVQAQSKISFGDEPQTVLSLVKYSTAQINSSQSEISAQYKPIYENGVLMEVVFIQKNLSNLYGTLTQYFTARNRYIFSNNQLSKKLVEIPEKSIAEVKKAIENSNQFNFIDKYIFSEDYENVYSIFLNSSKIATIQSLPTKLQSFPPKVQMQIDSIFKVKLAKEESKQLENEQYEQEQKLEKESKDENTLVAVKKMAEFVGGTNALMKYISQNLQIPNDATDLSGKVIVNFIVDKNGAVNNVEILKSNLKNKNGDVLTTIPLTLKNEIVRVFEGMPKWSPSESYDGTKHNVSYTIPLTFKQRENED